MVLLKRRNDILFVAKGDHIYLLDLQNERDHHIQVPEPVIPENLTKGQIDILKKETRNITSIAFSNSEDYTAVSTENKQVILFDKDFSVIKNFIVNRAASKVFFTPSNDILVADKTGDVYLYDIKSERQEPILLLGHLSVILDVVLTDCGRYIITCDRDEKIRVSCFPNAYNIVSFCLGHKEFVTSIKLVKKFLVSSSGDGTVRFWNYIKGQQLGIINTNEHFTKSTLLETFAKQMDQEKVDVTALPISDMQIYEGDKLYIAVSVYSYNGILVYATDLSSFKSDFITKIDVGSNCFTFDLSQELYILSDKFVVFKLCDNSFMQCNNAILEKLYNKYKDVLKRDEDNAITVLYKRKFDNVQEYLERKKQRLGAK